jgi:MFS superfamily sulfate permease-like transporter
LLWFSYRWLLRHLPSPTTVIIVITAISLITTTRRSSG